MFSSQQDARLDSSLDSVVVLVLVQDVVALDTRTYEAMIRTVIRTRTHTHRWQLRLGNPVKSPPKNGEGGDTLRMRYF